MVQNENYEVETESEKSSEHMKDISVICNDIVKLENFEELSEYLIKNTCSIMDNDNQLADRKDIEQNVCNITDEKLKSVIAEVKGNFYNVENNGNGGDSDKHNKDNDENKDTG